VRVGELAAHFAKVSRLQIAAGMPVDEVYRTYGVL